MRENYKKRTNREMPTEFQSGSFKRRHNMTDLDISKGIIFGRSFESTMCEYREGTELFQVRLKRLTILIRVTDVLG
jgi:hypothetical protein